MHIITKKRLQEFWLKHSDSEESLISWYKITKKANWKNLVEVRKNFPHADLTGVCTIFNIGGNKYRYKKVLIRFVMTHAEYNKKTYRNDCEC